MSLGVGVVAVVYFSVADFTILIWLRFQMVVRERASSVAAEDDVLPYLNSIEPRAPCQDNSEIKCSVKPSEPPAGSAIPGTGLLCTV
jgi:hypothetical protein